MFIKSPDGFQVSQVTMEVPKGKSINEAEHEALALSAMFSTDVVFEFNGETYRTAFEDLRSCVSKVPKL